MKRHDQRESSGRSAAGRIGARPSSVAGAAPVSVHTLSLPNAPAALLHVPHSYRADTPAPLAVMLHGAGGDAHSGMRLLQAVADQFGLIVLAPASRGRTWDVILGGFGPDVAAIDQALETVFQQYAVDPARLAVGGFSDGASYALSVGITNGDLFTHVIAFSPGFAAPAAQHGASSLFISHGTQDVVLPIDRCSRRIVPEVQRAGYDVVYREFDGPHTVPPAIVHDAITWFVGD